LTRKTKVRVVGDPNLVAHIALTLADYYEFEKAPERYGRAVGRDYAHSNAPGSTVYIVVKKPKKVDQKSRCPKCGGQLILKKFVDAWNEDNTPSKADINEDLYCPECDLRWAPEYGPHNFAELEETP